MASNGNKQSPCWFYFYLQNTTKASALGRHVVPADMEPRQRPAPGIKLSNILHPIDVTDLENKVACLAHECMLNMLAIPIVEKWLFIF